MLNQDRILQNIKADLLAMAQNEESGKSTDWRGALCCNLRALANIIERGDELPDPFPIFRPGGEILATSTAQRQNCWPT